MRLKPYSFLCGILLLSGIAAQLTAQARLDPNGLKSPLSITQPTEVPGSTLPAGKYSIHIVGDLSDRLILRIDDRMHTDRPAFIGLLHNKLAAPAHPGAIPFDSGSEEPTALRGFAFPGGPVIEFVYPKDEAISLAKKNASSVVAIDPASEGMKTNPDLSKQDMEVVTLWTLSPTPVSPGESTPSIKAERYQLVASATPKPHIRQLPHTASDLPWIVLFGLLALIGAATIRVARQPFAQMQ
ncbi:hypothetical protein [Granulicella arctica]|uniref:Uncharacterized protein n=1 Tax=Granulicella arctica TaxID=940613 RepID=A0A7Y9PJY8_9BACT|nr:hypothetical protein [Granulicella arctica]NYF81275.1 hypothetical protein [Granulicella arctica]